MENLVKQTPYQETNQVARSPTLQTVLMVEKFIDNNSGEYKKFELESSFSIDFQLILILLSIFSLIIVVVITIYIIKLKKKKK